jgi:hypothetical protein
MELPRNSTVIVTVGHEELEHGRVRAELHEDGRLSVAKVEDGRDAHFDGRLEETTARELVSRAQAVHRRALRSERTEHRPVPDEALYLIELRRAGEEPITVEVWAGELDRDSDIGQLVRALDAEVRRATEGQALL